MASALDNFERLSISFSDLGYGCLLQACASVLEFGRVRDGTLPNTIVRALLIADLGCWQAGIVVVTCE